MINRFHLRILTPIFAALLLTACAQNFTETFDQGIALSPSDPATDKDGQPEATQAAFAQFHDIPIPGNAKMNMDRTLILGEKEAWIGRLVIDSRTAQAKLFDFFKHRTAQFGWQEITSVRSDTSVMTYTRGQRVATIQITSATLRGSKVTITVSPKGAEEFPAPAVDGTAPPPAPAQ